MTTKIILATESNTNIKFDLDDNNNLLLSTLYGMVSGSNYIRINSYHKNTHGLNCSYRSNGMVGKVIYINENILMCCYTEEHDALKLNKLLQNKTKLSQIDIIYKLLNQCNIPIKKPDDIIIKFWNSGVHYNNPGYNAKIKYFILSELNFVYIILDSESLIKLMLKF